MPGNELTKDELRQAMRNSQFTDKYTNMMLHLLRLERFTYITNKNPDVTRKMVNKKLEIMHRAMFSGLDMWASEDEINNVTTKTPKEMLRQFHPNHSDEKIAEIISQQKKVIYARLLGLSDNASDKDILEGAMLAMNALKYGLNVDAPRADVARAEAQFMAISAAMTTTPMVEAVDMNPDATIDKDEVSTTSTATAKHQNDSDSEDELATIPKNAKFRNTMG